MFMWQDDANTVNTGASSSSQELETAILKTRDTVKSLKKQVSSALVQSVF